MDPKKLVDAAAPVVAKMSKLKALKLAFGITTVLGCAFAFITSREYRELRQYDAIQQETDRYLSASRRSES